MFLAALEVSQGALLEALAAQGGRGRVTVFEMKEPGRSRPTPAGIAALKRPAAR